MTGRDRDEPRDGLSGMVADWMDGDLGADAIKSFSEVNRRGLEAATALITRMTDLIDGAGPAANGSANGSSRAWAASPGSADGQNDRETTAGLRHEVMRSIETWAEVMGDLVDASLDVLHRQDGSGAANPDGAAIVIGPIPPGGEGSHPVYARSLRGQGLVRCRVGRFETALGHTLSDAAVSVDPDVIIEGGDDQVDLIVRLADDVVPGRYHGYVFADGADASALPVEVHVSDRS